MIKEQETFAKILGKILRLAAQIRKNNVFL